MRTSFVNLVLNRLLADGVLAQSDSVLAVCAGVAERDVFMRLGLRNAVISNLDDRVPARDLAPLAWSRQDAMNLDFEDASVDFAFVADGLHHTSAPHQALLEMYRVARRGIVVIESRYSLLMRLANRLGLSPEYEVEAVVDNDYRTGGLNNGEIPNYIYRWTEAEFKKTIRSFDPRGKQRFRFFYGLNLPYPQAEMRESTVKLQVLRITEPVLRAVTRVFQKQCNSFAMVALKPSFPEDLWPWLTYTDSEVHFDCSYADGRFKTASTSAIDEEP